MSRHTKVSFIGDPWRLLPGQLGSSIHIISHYKLNIFVENENLSKLNEANR